MLQLRVTVHIRASSSFASRGFPTRYIHKLSEASLDDGCINGSRGDDADTVYVITGRVCSAEKKGDACLRYDELRMFEEVGWLSEDEQESFYV